MIISLNLFCQLSSYLQVDVYLIKGWPTLFHEVNYFMCCKIIIFPTMFTWAPQTSEKCSSNILAMNMPIPRPAWNCKTGDSSSVPGSLDRNRRIQGRILAESWAIMMGTIWLSATLAEAWASVLAGNLSSADLWKIGIFFLNVQTL